MTFSQMLRLNPYRLFFPLAVLCGLLGVGHWALFTVGYLKTGSGFLHALIQSQGFLGLVAVGFLMTFLPRAMGVKEASPAELWIPFSLAFFIPGGFLAGSPHLMTTAFLAVLGTLIFFAARRLPQKTKKVPSPLVLIDAGLLHAVGGSLLLLLGLSPDSAPWIQLMARQMIQLGFLLCLVMGMTGFLMPFITGYTDDPENDLSKPSFHAAAAGLIFFSFILEPWAGNTAMWIRALTALVHMGVIAKVWRPPLKRAPYVLAFRWSGLAVPLGLLGAALFPTYRVAMLHVVFIGGFSLMIFSFGTLVVLSHSAQAALLNKPLKILWVIYGFIGLSLVFRVWADFSSNHYMLILHNAAGAWMVGAMIWLAFIWKKLWLNPIPAEKK